jgi:hypothetical protein
MIRSFVLQKLWWESKALCLPEGETEKGPSEYRQKIL